ncbi:MAG: phosphotransferase [Gallionellaceae bacterium]|jgi:Ser/Thr protein kinase RdoA (MazF antagonist)
MGVIKKTLYRGNLLGKPRHRNLFLDMEENIHIHYRDLRIEMSRGEFEDFAAVFVKQSKELQEIIHKKNYQDGKLPNANQDDVRIWTESRLKHDVKYHPQRFSLEECGDGYHFHYRNYKILIDTDEFKQIAQLFKSLDVNAPYATTYDEVFDLLEDNDVDFMLDAGNIPGEKLAIAVAQHHIPKIRDIFNYIGFTQEIVGEERRYVGSRLTVIANIEKLYTALDYKRIRGFSHAGRLVDYLSRNGVGIDPNELNEIKCQVIDLYSSLNAGKKLNVELDNQLWMYSPANKQVIFPYSTSARGGKIEAAALYKSWSGLLARLQLGFVKPTKEVFTAEAQAALQLKVIESLNKDVAAFIAVDKIYMMGSAVRKDMGRYLAPFVHGKLAKLGSDIDILVELNPSRESEIPAHWHLINPESSNHCAVYHVAQIPLAGGAVEWKKKFPNMEFSHHIVDAYVYFPSHGYQQEKEDFLKKFGAKLFYERARDGVISRGGEEERIATRLTELYHFSQVMVEKMKVSTENAIFKIFAGEHDYILKLFKVSGNYNRSRVAEHTSYEEKLINQLKERNILTAGIIPADAADSTIENFPALLFERIPGLVQQRPEYALEKICAALAKIHGVQMEKPLKLAGDFTFDDICMIWLPLFHTYIKDPKLPTEIAQAFGGLIPLSERYSPGEHRAAMYARSSNLHCHGDVTPKNVIVDDQGRACFFDFNNAFYGPRMADIIDGAFEFSLAEKFIQLADFKRFDAFISNYSENNALTTKEKKDLNKWTELIGLIKFIKEVRVLVERPTEELRKKRALAIAEFVAMRAEK